MVKNKYQGFMEKLKKINLIYVHHASDKGIIDFKIL